MPVDDDVLFEICSDYLVFHPVRTTRTVVKPAIISSPRTELPQKLVLLREFLFPLAMGGHG